MAYWFARSHAITTAYLFRNYNYIMVGDMSDFCCCCWFWSRKYGKNRRRVEVLTAIVRDFRCDFSTCHVEYIRLFCSYFVCFWLNVDNIFFFVCASRTHEWNWTRETMSSGPCDDATLSTTPITIQKLWLRTHSTSIVDRKLIQYTNPTASIS